MCIINIEVSQEPLTFQLKKSKGENVCKHKTGNFTISSEGSIIYSAIVQEKTVILQ